MTPGPPTCSWVLAPARIVVSNSRVIKCRRGAQDPVRKEVPDAVATCRRAGIFVRMVTGDNIHTAQCIARECGILTPEGMALEGPVFRQMPEEELIAVLPRLQVSYA